jgi:glycosyltransferase involved in cell wall biosynthesis
VTIVGGFPLPGYTGLQVGWPAGPTLHRQWGTCRPDSIYVATEGPLGWSAVGAARRLKIPVFGGFHTNFHSYSRHYRVGWLQPVVSHYLRCFHSRTAGTLVATPDLRDRLCGLGLRNVRVLGRGVDSTLFNPSHRCETLRRSWGVANGSRVAIYVGRVAPEKNLGLAIDAYRAMLANDPALKFVIVGDGPARAALQQEHRDLIFAGLRTGDDLARHYASADIFLFPSETDTFGNVILEAMASGLAVVAYDYAAPRQHVRNGESGVLAPFGNALAFVEEAVKLGGAPLALRRICQRAREHASAFDWATVARRFAELLMGGWEDELRIGDRRLAIGN